MFVNMSEKLDERLYPVEIFVYPCFWCVFIASWVLFASGKGKETPSPTKGKRSPEKGRKSASPKSTKRSRSRSKGKYMFLYLI